MKKRTISIIVFAIPILYLLSLPLAIKVAHQIPILNTAISAAYYPALTLFGDNPYGYYVSTGMYFLDIPN